MSAPHVGFRGVPDLLENLVGVSWFDAAERLGIKGTTRSSRMRALDIKKP